MEDQKNAVSTRSVIPTSVETDLNPLARLGIKKWLLSEAERLGLLENLVVAYLRAARQVFHVDRLVDASEDRKRGAEAVFKIVSSSEAFLEMKAGEKRATLQLLRETTEELLERQLTALRADRAAARESIQTLRNEIARLQSAGDNAIGGNVKSALSRFAILLRMGRAMRAHPRGVALPIAVPRELVISFIKPETLVQAVGRMNIRAISDVRVAANLSAASMRRTEGTFVAAMAEQLADGQRAIGVLKGRSLNLAERRGSMNRIKLASEYEVIGSMSYSAMALLGHYFNERLADVLPRIGSSVRREDTDPMRSAAALADVVCGDWVSPGHVAVIRRLDPRQREEFLPESELVCVLEIRSKKRGKQAEQT